MLPLRSAVSLAVVGWSALASLAADSPPPDFARDVAPILTKYCAGCHNGTDREGELSLESFADLQEGGEKGAIVIPGRPDASLIVRALTGEIEPKMPPEDNPRPSESDIDILRAWIEAGAKGPAGSAQTRPELKTPETPPADGVRPYLTSLALSPDGKRLALGRYKSVELVDSATKQILAKSSELSSKVNGVAFSRDGSLFVASSGIAGLYGVATIGRTADGSLVGELQGHRDAIYDAELSPDGQILATCSYDRLIHIWDVASGEKLRSLAGHNGAIYDVAFSDDGSILASASADATIKLWRVQTGERLDTLGQPEGEQCTVSFTPDGGAILAGGADRQLRQWTLLSRDKPAINPLKFSRTAHNSSIVKLAVSPNGARVATASEGRELVIWDANTLLPIHRVDAQPDVVTGLAFSPSSRQLYVACIDGSWRDYQLPEDECNATESIATAEAAELKPVVVEDPPAASKSSEQEPNNSPAAANAIIANAEVNGVISAANADGHPDVDVFRFQVAKGQPLVLEINAAREKSPLDSKLEVLDAAGQQIPRVVLQAVRSSYFTFRGHDSLDVNDFRMHRAQDMELNEFVYANGEVMKLWMLPRGPDSGFLVYPGVGSNRVTYFGSTPLAHALNSPVYVVEPHPPSATLIPNGLPVFTLYYENDDDGRRQLGADSRVAFTAPADGEYVVRVSDVRGFGGDAYHYKLTVRPARPNFDVKMDAKNLSINAGSGKEFTVTAIRKDDFDGEINIEVGGLPPGFHATNPLTIEAGQSFARGVITADADAPSLTSENSKQTSWTASAKIDGKTVQKEAQPFGELKLAGPPKVLIKQLPATESTPVSTAGPNQLTTFEIAPGETIATTVRVERRDFDGEISFGKELSGRNLPHGVYVDNIGLNGVTLLAGESERTVFITARKWVPEQTRPFHLQADVDGEQTSWPVMLRVRNRPNMPNDAAKSAAAAVQNQ